MAWELEMEYLDHTGKQFEVKKIDLHFDERPVISEGRHMLRMAGEKQELWVPSEIVAKITLKDVSETGC